MMTKQFAKCVNVLGGALICLLLVSCARPRPGIFPDTDIVYQSSDDNNPSIGFVNADGSNNIVLPLDFYPARPTWSADGKTLYFIKIRGDYNLMQSGGYISFWQEGESVSTCWKKDWWNIVFVMPAPTNEPQQAVLFNDYTTLMLVDLKSCRELEQYMERETPTMYLARASLSQDEKFVSYTEASKMYSKEPPLTYTNYILALNTGEIIELGEGINPAVSPDNQWVAYTNYDGIYIVAINGSQNHRLVEYDSEDVPDWHFEIAPPAPRWSPGGQWLIYHKCIERHPDNCHHADEFSIFKVEVATGEEIKIVDGGVYPYWRWQEKGP